MSRRAVLACLLTAAVLLTGCVSVPTSGPVERVEGQPPGCTNCINVDVAPPTLGQEPKQIVEGFLRATSNFQPNYSVARQFLTPQAADRWSPEAGVLIYSGAPQADGERVVLEGRLEGTLASDRTFTPQDRPLRCSPAPRALCIDFGLVRNQTGEWRISRPPRGLPVASFAFSSFYQVYDLHFLSNGATLVPDPIYLPSLRSTAGIASVLLSALLKGPSAWLKPAVTTAVPPGTQLNGDAVTISDGVADVALSEPVLRLNETQRRLLAAQVVATLQPLGLQGVRFSVNSQPYAVPGADPDSFVLPVDAGVGELDPVPSVNGDVLYAMRSRGVEQVNARADVPDAKPLPGPLGAGRFRVQSLAVSTTGADLAVVTDGGTVLRRAAADGGVPSVALEDVQRLLRPQFSRYGELWAVGERNGRQQLWVIDRRRTTVVDLGDLGPGGRITAFRVSPDGGRLAAVRQAGGRTELGLARIIRSDKIVVDGWRPLQLSRSTTPDLRVLRDLAWADATALVVLGAASTDVPLQPYRVSQDAFKINSEGESNNWDAVSLTVSLQDESAILRTRSGQTWRNAGVQWTPYLDKVAAIAFPG